MVNARRRIREQRRAREFQAFTAGAGGRLLHVATLLTGDPGEAERLVVAALSRTYADWFRMRGEDPYAHARQELTAGYAHRAWRYRRPCGGRLDRLPPRERLVLVLRMYEGLADEQAAAQLGLPTERLRTLCGRAVAAMRSRDPAGRASRARDPVGRDPGGRDTGARGAGGPA
ncbi:sigma factor-like helix-turn-helix DNA-binding protein [Streptomyces sp. ICBB 8177]|uniref:sigma factor-like helix-turn-helix DNA-binding protein n=1 Tax=Streptomyces sp. ICBB 8177 TaxID=563922 RepID=UPI000D678FD5|nr:sigma factor-like helix-turn-helix DNA-binding protein [Streptomyces sp. ICBB 8177]PWI43835.1 RNA polymerase [Streptomyces sp. ICBB 8177]